MTLALSALEKIIPTKWRKEPSASDDDLLNDLPADEEEQPKKLKKPPKWKANKDRTTLTAKKWRLSDVIDHVTYSSSGDMMAWYLLDPQMWSFRSVEEGNLFITDSAVQLSELVGHTVHLRITSRPYPVARWAETTFRNAPHPTQGFVDMLERDQKHLEGSKQTDKLVYAGVSIGRTGLTDKTLTKMSKQMRARQLAALQKRVDRVDAVMNGRGIEASPATGDDMAWLLMRSFGLGCPAPDNLMSDQTVWQSSDLAEFMASVEWTQTYNGATKVTSTLNGIPITRYVVTMSVGRMDYNMMVPEESLPWIAKTDRLGFPVEWSARVTVRDPETTRAEMDSQVDRITSQHEHYVDDHGKRPPKQLARQMSQATTVEDEMRSGFDGTSTRTRGVYRLAVSDSDEERAWQKAQLVQELYKPGIKIHVTTGQYHLAREFVPHEPQATADFTRRLPVTTLAAGVPAASAEVGDKRGAYIGMTEGISERIVTFDPWYLMEVAETSGLIPVIGSLGSGKTWLFSGIIYKTGLSGAAWTVLDPSGMIGELAKLPELRGFSRSINLLNSEPGTLNPFRLVPQPRREWFENEIDQDRSYALALSSAQSQRRSLTIDTLKACLPTKYIAREDVESLLRDAVQNTPAHRGSAIDNTLEWLAYKGTEDAEILSRRINEIREHELGRLFFGEALPEDATIDSDTSNRMTFFSLKGMIRPQDDTPREDWSTEEQYSRPILATASWLTLDNLYRRSRHERKGVALDEAHEITSTGSGRQLVQKVSTDTRKHNLAAFVSTQNAANIFSADVANHVGAAFVGKTKDEAAQKAALKLLGLPEGVGYEQVLGRLSPSSRRSTTRRGFRQFIYRDGLGGDDGKGGIEQIRVDYSNHPSFCEVMDSTPDSQKTAAQTDEDTTEG